ncbi:MAG: hypothetical protein KIT80_04495 [Chitinophagaceae bacterium]|nr:hypothetical protein [Chitinophagaceae bacterium]MCW5926150.1 hypothetical protein [Chitinophagaceae bacterium]
MEVILDQAKKLFQMLLKKVRDKGIVYLVLIGILLNGYLFFKGRSDMKLFREKGIIILAIITDKTESDNAIMLECKYRFKNIDYYISYPQHRIHQSEDSLVFLHILPDNPRRWMQLDKYVVPSCLTLDNVPDTGWRSLPLNNCK